MLFVSFGSFFFQKAFLLFVFLDNTLYKQHTQPHDFNPQLSRPSLLVLDHSCLPTSVKFSKLGRIRITWTTTAYIRPIHLTYSRTQYLTLTGYRTHNTYTVPEKSTLPIIGPTHPITTCSTQSPYPITKETNSSTSRAHYAARHWTH